VSILKEVGAPNLSDFFPKLKFLDLQGIRKRSIVSVKKVLSIFKRFVGERLKMRQGTGSIGNDDVLDALLNISLDDGKIEMDKDEIEHLLLVCFLLFLLCLINFLNSWYLNYIVLINNFYIDTKVWSTFFITHTKKSK
jgi:hypothetical protein